jgi:four helix bundle protein
MAGKGYKKLKAYEEAHRLVKEIYAITATFPKSELFGLVSQMRRAAVSVAANIIEGQARLSKNEFRQFLSIANGSLVELEYYLELARDLQYISPAVYEKLEAQRHHVGLLLGGLRKHLIGET